MNAHHESLPEVKEFFADSIKALADHGLRSKLEHASTRHLSHLEQAKAEFPNYEHERDEARRIKAEAIARLPQLLGQLKQSLERNGCSVFFAADAEEARRYIVALAREHGVTSVIKGKSMTTEEIALNQAFAEAQIEAVETDLGEYIVQLRGERPSHIITPAIHLSKEDIGKLFEEKLGTPYTDQPSELTAIARQRLREKFLNAGMGVVGVNFAVAETGTMVLVENEGNGRMSNTLPELLVAVMGIEKVVPRLDDVSHLLEVLPRTATGQKLSAYTSFLSRPRQAGETDGPREIHVVILDNGRSAMLADPILREALYCLRCGACLNVCPVYRRIGGHAYGATYSGPIGSVISPTLVPAGKAAHLAFASTLCGACREVCPVKIDIPRLLLHLRWKISEATTGTSIDWPKPARGARWAARRLARLALQPKRLRRLATAARVLASPFARDGYLRWVPSAFSGWTRSRDFPLPRNGTRNLDRG